ncbi:MAG: hypothetical protein WAV56_04085 [Microgenomates group bacterium]
MFKLIKKLSIFTSLFLMTLVLLEYIDVTTKPVPTVAGVSQSLPNIKPPEYTTVFSALPSQKSDIITSVKTADARAEILRQYLARYESPLEPLADLIVSVADENDFDYRWMVAIAQQESNLCKRIPADSYNCWGWGIYPEPDNPEVLKVTRFDSFEDAIRRIAPQFKEIFLQDNHSKDPFKVMKTYTPPSDGSWAEGINQFFTELQ